MMLAWLWNWLGLATTTTTTTKHSTKYQMLWLKCLTNKQLFDAFHLTIRVEKIVNNFMVHSYLGEPFQHSPGVYFFMRVHLFSTIFAMFCCILHEQSNCMHRIKNSADIKAECSSYSVAVLCFGKSDQLPNETRELNDSGIYTGEQQIANE